MFAESSSSVWVAPWEKVFASLFTSLVEGVADISINKSRDSKEPWKCPYSMGIDAAPPKKTNLKIRVYKFTMLLNQNPSMLAATGNYQGLLRS